MNKFCFFFLPSQHWGSLSSGRVIVSRFLYNIITIVTFICLFIFYCYYFCFCTKYYSFSVHCRSHDLRTRVNAGKKLFDKTRGGVSLAAPGFSDGRHFVIVYDFEHRVRIPFSANEFRTFGVGFSRDLKSKNKQ